MELNRHTNRYKKDRLSNGDSTLAIPELGTIFHDLDLSHGAMNESVSRVKDILNKIDRDYTIPPYSGLLLVGGGSGTAVAGRSLYQSGVRNFAMLANTGEMGVDRSTGQTLGGGMIFEEILTATDNMDVLKQSIHATPSEVRNYIHDLLDQSRGYIQFGNLVLEALRQLMGDPQKAVDLVNYWMQNPYRVLPTTLDRTELYMDMGDRVLGSNEYGQREDPHEIADHPVLSPPAFLSQEAKDVIRGASTIILGPGDVFFSVIPHWGVVGFQEALFDNSDAKIILVVNLTARRGDTTDFRLTDYLKLYQKFLPKDRIIEALFNLGDVAIGDKLIDDIPGQTLYEHFRITRADIGGDSINSNGQLLHDENRFGSALKGVIESLF